jgi:hypothetical protein
VDRQLRLEKTTIPCSILNPTISQPTHETAIKCVNSIIAQEGSRGAVPQIDMYAVQAISSGASQTVEELYFTQ